MKRICYLYVTILLILLNTAAYATVITTSATWTTNHTYSGDLEIANNAVLTLNGSFTQYTNTDMSIIIHPGGKLVVQNGATIYMKYTGLVNVNGGSIRVVADYNNPTGTINGGILEVTSGSTITGDIDWTGISVSGVKNEIQLLYGRFAMATFNNATISNAFVAVLNYDGYYSGNVSNSYGGIIRCTNTTFLDNALDVDMHDYLRRSSPSSTIYVDASTFSGCTFTTSGTIQHQSIIEDNSFSLRTNVHLSQVEGVQFYGCTFSNSTSGTYPYQKQNAIIAMNAGLQMDRLGLGGGSYKNGSIQNYLGNGAIFITNPSNFHRAIISNTTMDYNVTAINITGAINPKITANNITVRGVIDGTARKSTGIYLAYSTGYQIEANTN